MTKTKAQLRAEAVERLKTLNCMDVSGHQVLKAAVDDDGEDRGYRVEIRKLIDMLTDEELPEGDAVAILRKAASYDGDYSSSSEALRRLTDSTTVYFALETLADMVERDYVRRDSLTDNATVNYKKADSLQDSREKLEEDVSSFNPLRGLRELANTSKHHTNSEWKKNLLRMVNNADDYIYRFITESLDRQAAIIKMEMQAKLGELTVYNEASDDELFRCSYCHCKVYNIDMTEGDCGWGFTFCPQCGGEVHESDSRKIEAELEERDRTCTFAYDGEKADDSREKLKNDVREYSNKHIYPHGDVIEFRCQVFDWLDRQAAITTQECNDVYGSGCEACRRAQKREIAELQEQVDALEAELDTKQGALNGVTLRDLFGIWKDTSNQLEADSREKLIEDIRDFSHAVTNVDKEYFGEIVCDVIRFIDRQAAITEREYFETKCHDCQDAHDRQTYKNIERYAKLKEQVDELKATLSEERKTNFNALVSQDDRIAALEEENRLMRERLRSIADNDVTVFGMKLDEVRGLKAENAALREKLSKAIGHAHDTVKLGGESE